MVNIAAPHYADVRELRYYLHIIGRRESRLASFTSRSFLSCLALTAGLFVSARCSCLDVGTFVYSTLLVLVCGPLCQLKRNSGNWLRRHITYPL